MRKLLENNKVFLVPFMVVWLIIAVVLTGLSKADIHLFLNKFHTPFFDLFFRVLTVLGDGLAPAIIAVVVLFASYRKSFVIGFGAILAGIFSQSLKRGVFHNMQRPKAYFENIAELYFVPGVEVHSHFTFPSGHTTTAFCLFFILASLSDKRAYKIACLIAAILVGYSRVYLSQHFLVDVYFGAILGLISAFISIQIISNMNVRWLDKSLITMFSIK